MRQIILGILITWFPAYAEDIKFFQSDSDKSINWLEIDNCRVKIPTSKIKDICYTLKVMNDTCKLGLDLRECT
jgi:hypothetical protein